MKRSEELHREAQSEDNDIKATGMHLRAFREERREDNKERFDRDFLPLLRKLWIVEENTDYCRLDTQTHGTIIIYPKANKVHIHKGNRWISRGAMGWITKNLLNGMR